MKYFNVAVVTAWLAMFALSLRPINGNDPQYWGALDNLMISFNETGSDICNACAYPDEPFAEYNIKTGQYDIVAAHALPIADNRMTRIILTNTFWFLVFMMSAINLAFCAGNGTAGRILRMPLQYGDRQWRAYQFRRANKAAGITLRPPVESREVEEV